MRRNKPFRLFFFVQDQAGLVLEVGNKPEHFLALIRGGGLVMGPSLS